MHIIEKKWIAYQLLTGLAYCHGVNVFHGDIKTENVMISNSNWAYLTDFSGINGFKPVYLPEDNPFDFSFFFDVSLRRICYIAPERFYSKGSEIPGRFLTPSMDIFSLGCTIAELFLEGNPLFSFSQLLRYRSGEFDPTAEINKIPDAEIRVLPF